MKRYPFKANDRLGAASETLFFLGARKSNKNSSIKGKTYTQLLLSIAQSEA
jgi:hypothetical protein